MGDNKAEGDEGTIYQFRKATCITIFFVSSESIGHHTPGNFEAIWLPAKVAGNQVKQPSINHSYWKCIL